MFCWLSPAAVLCSPSHCWDKASGPLLPSLVHGTENSFEWPSQTQLPLPLQMQVFHLVPIHFFCGHCSAKCDLENDAGKINGYWEKIGTWTFLVFIPGISYDTSHDAFKTKELVDTKLDGTMICQAIAGHLQSLPVCGHYFCNLLL